MEDLHYYLVLQVSRSLVICSPLGLPLVVLRQFIASHVVWQLLTQHHDGPPLSVVGAGGDLDLLYVETMEEIKEEIKIHLLRGGNIWSSPGQTNICLLLNVCGPAGCWYWDVTPGLPLNTTLSTITNVSLRSGAQSQAPHQANQIRLSILHQCRLVMLRSHHISSIISCDTSTFPCAKVFRRHPANILSQSYLASTIESYRSESSVWCKTSMSKNKEFAIKSKLNKKNGIPFLTKNCLNLASQCLFCWGCTFPGVETGD